MLKFEIDFWVGLWRKLRPKFHNRITATTVIAGLAIIGTPLWERILTVLLTKELDLSLTDESDALLGFGLVFVALVYNACMHMILSRFPETESNTIHIETAATSIESDKEWLRINAPTEPLSIVLPRLTALARQLDSTDVERWETLELNGYYENNGMTNTDTVPTYRTVSGEYRDEYGHPLVISDPNLSYVNEDRLSQGVAELEAFSTATQSLQLRDPRRCKLIRDHLDVTVTQFCFAAPQVVGILSRIRQETLARVSALNDS